MLLRTGSKEESVLKLSDKILHHFDGLRMLKDATLEEPCQYTWCRGCKGNSAYSRF